MASRRYTIGRLGLLLTLAFVGVALAAIVMVSILATRSSNRDIAGLVYHREQTIASATATASGVAYEAANYRPGGVRPGANWNRVDLHPIFIMLSREGGKAQVRALNGTVAATSPSFASTSPSGETTRRVVVRGQTVGSVTVRFAPAISSIAATFDRHRWRDRVAAAGFASLLALAVGLILSRWITMPVEAVLVALRIRGEGDRSYRISDQDMRGLRLLRELPTSFNASVDLSDARLRAHRNLIADVAHELRTPVAILQASHEAMLDGVTEPSPENLASLRDEVLRLARRVEDLQHLASAESAAMQLRLVNADLAEIAGSAAAALADAFAAADIGLEHRLTPVQVRCDPDRIREVVINLMTNALKFTPPGGRVVLAAGPDQGGDAAVLTVTDTGIGIPPDELPHVTERFFRGRRSAEMARGSGIGLTIVSELVRAHQGRVEFASTPGQGTEVTVTLPLADQGAA
ncbi:MAG: HAMP domain-containing sensor histidine kinase [Actinomycetota bacterium]|nr:HAMP domain-containing sensor histidine kinase [Actinomycetota bacterium]